MTAVSAIATVTEVGVITGGSGGTGVVSTARFTASKVSAAELLASFISEPDKLVRVSPVPAVFNLATTPVCELLSLKALIAEDKPSAVLPAVENEMVVAVVLLEVTLIEKLPKPGVVAAGAKLLMSISVIAEAVTLVTPAWALISAATAFALAAAG